MHELDQHPRAELCSVGSTVQRHYARSALPELAVPPTFAETRSEIARMRRQSGATQSAVRRRLERDVKRWVSWELEWTMKLPSEQATLQLTRLSRRRDQILAQIDSAASSRQPASSS